MHYGKPDKKKEWRSCRKLEKSTIFGGQVWKNILYQKQFKEKEKLNLVDVWAILKPIIIQRTLDYFFMSNQLQETFKKTDILAAFISNHTPSIFT